MRTRQKGFVDTESRAKMGRAPASERAYTHTRYRKDFFFVCVAQRAFPREAPASSLCVCVERWLWRACMRGSLGSSLFGAGVCAHHPLTSLLFEGDESLSTSSGDVEAHSAGVVEHDLQRETRSSRGEVVLLSGIE